ncbi:DUF1476 domain-containing protein [Enterovirga sp. CN4-39]|uniref:DUF1476 domain-containing protein n=1 Tax=Enterovirga sp. CN4-39 TaxID=3400910 RepID=UPI003C06AD32
MTLFTERERAFENLFARQEELRFRATALRNRLLGQWAATRLGLAGDAAAAYVGSFERSLLSQKSELEVETKLRDDFERAGIAMSEADIHAKMTELLEEAVQRVAA